MSTVVAIQELPARFDELLKLAAAGNEILVSDGTAPRARLIPYAVPQERVAGLHVGAAQISADFDAPLPDEFWTGRS